MRALVRGVTGVLVALGSAQAAASGTAQWVGSTSTNWSNGANWTAQSGTPSLPPGTADTALFSGNPTQACTLDTAQTVAAVSMASNFTGSNAMLTLTAQLSTGNFSMSAGTLVMNGQQILITGTLGGGNLDLLVVGTVTASTGSAFVMSGNTGTQLIAVETNYAGGLTINYSSQLVTQSVTGTLTVANGQSLDLDGQELNVVGAGTPINLNSSGTIKDSASSGTLYYSSSTPTNVQGPRVSVGNVVVGNVSGAGTIFTQQGAFNSLGTLVVNQNASGQTTYAAGANLINVGGSVDTRSGILTSTGGIQCAGFRAGGAGSLSLAGQLVFTGTGPWSSTTGTANFGTVTLDPSASVTAASNILVASLSIGSGANLDMNNGGASSTLTLEGGPGAVFSVFGTGSFTPGGSAQDVVFAGSGGNITWSGANVTTYGAVSIAGGTVAVASNLAVKSLEVGDSATFETSSGLFVTDNLETGPTGIFEVTGSGGVTFEGSSNATWIDLTPGGQHYGVVTIQLQPVSLLGSAVGVQVSLLQGTGSLDLAGEQLTLGGGSSTTPLNLSGTIADSVGTGTIKYEGAPSLIGVISVLPTTAALSYANLIIAADQPSQVFRLTGPLQASTLQIYAGVLSANNFSITTPELPVGSPLPASLVTSLGGSLTNVHGITTAGGMTLGSGTYSNTGAAPQVTFTGAGTWSSVASNNFQTVVISPGAGSTVTAASNVSVSALTVSNGNFDLSASGSTLSLGTSGGSLTVASGANFTPAAAGLTSVDFNTGGAATWALNGTGSFGDVSIAGSSSVTMQTAIPAHSLTVASGATLTFGSSELLTLGGDFSVSGALVQSGTSGVTFAANGGVGHAWTETSSQNAGEIVINDNVTLGGPAGSANLTLSSGTLSLSSNTIAVGGNLTIGSAVSPGLGGITFGSGAHLWTDTTGNPGQNVGSVNASAASGVALNGAGNGVGASSYTSTAGTLTLSGLPLTTGFFSLTNAASLNASPNGSNASAINDLGNFTFTGTGSFTDTGSGASLSTLTLDGVVSQNVNSAPTLSNVVIANGGSPSTTTVTFQTSPFGCTGSLTVAATDTANVSATVPLSVATGIQMNGAQATQPTFLASQPITVASGGIATAAGNTLALASGTNNVTGNVTANGPLSSTGLLQLNGTGTVSGAGTLSLASLTFAGATTVARNLAATNVVLNPGATLALGPSDILTVGGNLTVGGTLTTGANSGFAFQTGPCTWKDSTGTPGQSYGLVTISSDSVSLDPTGNGIQTSTLSLTGGSLNTGPVPVVANGLVKESSGAGITIGATGLLTAKAGLVANDSSTFTNTAGGELILAGSGNWGQAGGVASFGPTAITGGTIGLSSAIVPTGALSVTGGTLEVNGETLQVNGNASFSGTGSLNASPGVSASAITCSGNWSATGSGTFSDTASSSTVTLTGGTLTTIATSGGFANPGLANLVIAKTGSGSAQPVSGNTLQLAGGLAVSGGTLDLATNDDSVVVNGSVSLAGGALSAASTSDLQFTGSGVYAFDPGSSAVTTAGTLTLDGTATVNVQNNPLQVTGTTTIGDATTLSIQSTSGATFDGPVTVKGANASNGRLDLVANATFNGPVTLATGALGGVLQALGSSPITIAFAAGQLVQVESGALMHIPTAGTQLVSNTPGTQWQILFASPAVESLGALQIQDSNANPDAPASDPPGRAPGGTDLGDNINWFNLAPRSPPAFTSLSSASFAIGVQGTFTVTTTGIPVSVVSSSGALPNGVTFVTNGNGTATLSGTPAAGSAGPYPLTFTAQDEDGVSTTQSFTLFVDQPPSLTSVAATTFEEGVADSFTVTATGYPLPALSESGALPAGVTFADNGNGTATLSGTATSSGSFPLTLTAQNGVSPAATQSFSLAVTAGCAIGGTFFASGAIESTNSCMTCQPSVSITSWSNLTDGTACGAALICASGSCASDCDIGSTIVTSGTVNGSNACQVCQPGASNTGWTTLATGASCGTGLICTSGTCSSDCDIGGTLVAAGTLAVGNPCQTCQPLVSTTAWSDSSNGTTCGSGGSICGNGACTIGCAIDGGFYSSDAGDPANPCQTCQPLASTSAWTNLVNGAPCDDGNACTQVDQCQNGVCQGSDPVVCPQLDPCSLASCIIQDGGCQSQPLSGVACDGGSGCVGPDVCQLGACRLGVDNCACGRDSDCAAPRQCQASVTCNLATRLCQYTNQPDGAGCDDGNACTQVDLCQSGTCVGSSPVVCQASDPCHVAGTCLPGDGGCTNPIAADGTDCDGGQACLLDTSCLDGACVAGQDTCTCSQDSDCVAPTQCQASVTCNPATNTCQYQNQIDGTVCNDQNACTVGETCESGICGSPTFTQTCTALDQCHRTGTCDPSSGLCSNPKGADGTPCDDGRACTLNDVCQGGLCEATINDCVCNSNADCSPLDQCHQAGTCDLDAGLCSNPPLGDGTPCNDNDLCTVGETCQQGACGTPISITTCPPASECHGAGTCDPASGQCSNPDADAGAECGDGGATCNGAGACVTADAGSPAASSSSGHVTTGSPGSISSGVSSGAATSSSGTAGSSGSAGSSTSTSGSGTPASSGSSGSHSSSSGSTAAVSTTGSGFASASSGSGSHSSAPSIGGTSGSSAAPVTTGSTSGTTANSSTGHATSSGTTGATTSSANSSHGGASTGSHASGRSAAKGGCGCDSGLGADPLLVLLGAAFGRGRRTRRR